VHWVVDVDRAVFSSGQAKQLFFIFEGLMVNDRVLRNWEDVDAALLGRD